MLPKTRGGGRDAGASGPSSSNGSGIYVGHHARGSRGPQRATIDAKAIVAARSLHNGGLTRVEGDDEDPWSAAAASR